MSIRRWFARFGINVVLIAGSLGAAYLAVGAVYLSLGPRFLPDLINYFPVAATIWWQPSAPHPERETYIALLGDSYAAGIGDWKAARRDSDAPYHSADVIRGLTGRPVLSFGRSGAGSAEALVLQPAEALDAGRCVIFPQPRLPSEVVVYFYEGNDLDNNVAYVEEVLSLRLDDPQLPQRVAAQLAADYGIAGRESCVGYFASALYGMFNTVRFMLNSESPADVSSNTVLIGGRPTQIPGNLQGPALELSEAEIAATLIITEQSLRWLRARLPGVPVTVVLVPSVLTVYRSAAQYVSAQVYHDGDETQSAGQVAANSDLICTRLNAIVERQSMRFVDARPALRAAARDSLLHGPRDWRHFNQLGYTRLGETVAAALTGAAAPAGCAALAQHTED